MMEYEVPTTMNEKQTMLRIVRGKLRIVILAPLFCMFLILTASSGTVAAAPQAVIAGQAAETPADIHVLVGRSLVVRSEENLQRVSVTNPAVASAAVISPTQVLIHGLAAGTVTLILWDEQDQTRSFNLIVDLDLNALAQEFSQILPNEEIRLAQSGAALVLSGPVSSKEVADRAAALAATRAASVINLMVPVEGRQIVMLQVRFAEVNRSAISQLGMNLMSLGAANTIGATSTQQFTPPQLQEQGIGQNQGGFALSDLLNIFLFRPDIDLAVTIKALQAKNVLQILAEPNVMALNGREASFLAGGEFPFPVLQGGNNFGVTIQFREFGVRLNFTPTVQADNTIRLRVAPEVSALDFANALTISGFTVPALSSRKAQTEVELRDGQSFAIAGLIDKRMTDIASKIPVLGDIPILGNFFKSRNTNKNNTELLVMVTPRVVRPLDPTNVPAGPEFPQPFLDQERFDGPRGETSALIPVRP
jgi:pilus assembly protein CpaC